MANINGLPVNSAVTHAEFMSRTEDTSTTGSVNFQNVTESTSSTTGAIKTAGGLGVAKSLNVGLDAEIGGTLTVQTNLDVNGVATVVGTLNTADIAASGNINTTLDMSASNILAVGNVEAQTEMITPLITATTADVGTLNLTNAFTAPSLTVTTDATINGNLTVNGTTVTLNTATVDSEDPNITVNKTGNDASSEGAGLTVDRTGTKGSLVYANALASKFKIGDLASEAEVVTVSHAQTLTNKTLTSPVLTTPSTDIISATEQGSTPATPASGVRKLYPKADGFYQLDSTGLETKVGSGSGGGGAVNLITNGSADDAIASIFTPYADAAGTRPVDGTGGSPTVTTSISAVSPLTGTKSYLLTKPASNTQGEGWAVSTIPLDLSYRAKVLKISVDYVVNSGTFVAGSRTTDSDIIWTCYDITNSKIVEPSNIKMFSSSTTISDKFEATVQFDYNCTSFRLIAHVATTSTAAYEIKVDNVTVSHSVYVYGTPITDFKTVSNPAIIGSSSGTYNPGTGSIYKTEVARNGQEWLVNYYIDIGTSAVDIVGAHVFNLPAECKFHSDIQAYEVVGYGEITNVSTANPVARMTAKVFGTYASNQVILDVTDVGLLNAATSFMTNSSNIVSVKLRFKGMGNSASVQMSDSADTRVISFSAYPNATALAANGTIPFSVVEKDTHGAVSSNQYRVPVAGDYIFSATLISSAVTAFRIKKNGSLGKYVGQVSLAGGIGGGSITLTNLVVGDLIEVVTENAATITGSVSLGISISRISGPSAIAASETVNLRYTNTAGTSIANSGDIVVPFATRDFDSHGSWVTDTFTAQTSGKYEVNVKLSFASAAYAAGNRLVASIYKNGSFYTYGAYVSVAGATTLELGVSLNDTVSMLAGETLQIRVSNNRTAGATSIGTSSNSNSVNIKRVGN